MATLTNTSKAGLGLPDGRMIAPGASVEDVKDADLKHPVVAAWLGNGSLKKGESAARDAKQSDGKAIDDMTDEELRGFLVGHSVTADGRWSRERLLTEAKKVKA